MIAATSLDAIWRDDLARRVTLPGLTTTHSLLRTVSKIPETVYIIYSMGGAGTTIFMVHVVKIHEGRRDFPPVRDRS